MYVDLARNAHALKSANIQTAQSCSTLTNINTSMRMACCRKSPVSKCSIILEFHVGCLQSKPRKFKNASLLLFLFPLCYGCICICICISFNVVSVGWESLTVKLHYWSECSKTRCHKRNHLFFSLLPVGHFAVKSKVVQLYDFTFPCSTATEISGIFVKSIGENSAAALDGRLQVNDQIIQVCFPVSKDPAKFKKYILPTL